MKDRKAVTHGKKLLRKFQNTLNRYSCPTQKVTAYTDQPTIPPPPTSKNTKALVVWEYSYCHRLKIDTNLA